MRLARVEDRYRSRPVMAGRKGALRAPFFAFKTLAVCGELLPAIPARERAALPIEMAGTRPAITAKGSTLRSRVAAETGG